jgi:hypothetical protein
MTQAALKKVDPPSGAATCYSVTIDGRLIGYVWSERGFSYRGDQGWNRGIRLKDFHPWEWHYSGERGGSSGRTYSRKQAVELLRELPEGD